jgi:16S rRNA (uracil1498-N3)-methyltransferase
VVLFDGGGCEFPAEILEVKRDLVRVQVADGRRVDRESSLELCLGIGLCQPATMDLVIQKVTELGVTEIVPMKTERGLNWLTGQKAAAKHGRWQRIVREAARQSGRNRVPRILPVNDFATAIHRGSTTGIKLIFWEEEERGNLKQTLATASQPSQVRALIGPEGGFSEEEVGQATAVGFQSVSLGQRVLRTETAAIAVVSLLQYELGDLGLLP